MSAEVQRLPMMARPKQGFSRIGQCPEVLLLLCFYDPSGIATVPETVAWMQSKSRFPITVLNLFEHRQDTGCLKLSPNIDLDSFSGVVIHNSISYNVDNLRSLDELMRRKLKDYCGVKVLMKQDENHRFRELAQYLSEVGFDLVFTCLPEEAVSKVYPPNIVGPIRFERMFTGYVTPTMRAIMPLSELRPIDIGYRGSIQPLPFGRLAFEKRKIGDDVTSLLADKRLKLDISSRWEDRFGGDAWFDFLGSCKATLGTESGASVFDLNSDLEARCRAAEEKLGPFREDHEYAEAYLAYLADLEDNVHYHQISPRHFEAVATGTIQLLYPGQYSGILVPRRHFFPLERDYANLDEAINLILDERRRREMVEAAYEEVVLNRAYWIENLVERFDVLVQEQLAAKGLLSQPLIRSNSSARNVLLIAAHNPPIDPRLGWIAEGANGDLRIHQLGVLLPGISTEYVECSEGGGGRITVAYPRKSWSSRMGQQWCALVGLSPAGMAGVHELLFIEKALTLTEERFCELFGAPPGCERVKQFRWLLQYLLDTAATLVENASRVRGLHAVIATDLDALPAALVLKGIFDAPVLYDAHEYWPDADHNSFEFEKQFWVGLEQRLVPYADYRQTVSPGLASLMSTQYGVHFEAVPNCEPIKHAMPLQQASPPPRDRCLFLFQGGFAVGRGIDLLIKAWPGTDQRAVLLLRGPDNPYKQQMIELAITTGLLGKRILFPASVPESKLVQAAAEADVGLIPYAPASINHQHCCPNKMSQYMAAGLPILANRTSFVAATVQDARCGRTVDFARASLLIGAVNEMTADSELRKAMGWSGHCYFLERFNWDVCSTPLYNALDRLTSAHSPSAFRVLVPSSGGEKVHLVPTTFSSPADELVCLTLHSVSIWQLLRVICSRVAYGLWRRIPLPVREMLRPIVRGLFRKSRA